MQTSTEPNPGIAVTLTDLLATRETAKALRRHPPRRARRVRSGPHLSTHKGRGMEFEEVRIYQPGDDIRYMDWRVTARTGKPHTKQFQEERERPVFVLCDLGTSMRFGTRVAFKSVVAARVAAILAWAAVDGGDRLGGLVFAGATHRELRPRMRTRSALAFLRALVDIDNGADLAPAGEPLQNALAKLARIAHPGATVYLLSDFFSLNDAGLSSIRQLARHTDVRAVAIHDPIEARLPGPGRFAFSDGRERLLYDATTTKMLHDYEQRFEQLCDARTTRLRSAGATCLTLATDADLATQLGQLPH